MSLHVCRIKLVQETNAYNDQSFLFISVRYLATHSTRDYVRVQSDGRMTSEDLEIFRKEILLA
jgi:hypothetical protein